MPTVAATLPLPATAARFALVDAAGHAYRGLSFGSERAARQYLERQPAAFRRMLATAGYRVGPVGAEGLNPASTLTLNGAEGVGSTDAAAPTTRDCQAPASGSSTGAARPVDNAARPATTRLILAIGETSYAVRRLNVADRSFGVVRAVRLRRLDNGELHDVAQTIDGHTCTCADATFRHEEGNAMCKHVRCLIAWGLLA